MNVQKGSSAKASDASRNLHGDRIAAQLSSEILTGVLPPRTKLDEQGLTERFGVSRTPVREALHKLVAQSLAERIPYRGVVVSEITRERVEQMFETMGEIEALCGRFAAERMTMGERADLEELHQAMNKMADALDINAYRTANTEFHQRIFEATHNADMLELATTLRQKLAPFRSSQLGIAERLQQSSTEHGQIVQGLMERDGEATARALRRHMVSAAKQVLHQME
ncbi:GntR family transcriptional regulator [Jannaschia sp. 2305UL9-9]|uniref:GntR family transcriptional regulator n=1 Tax=Jannaschia sp. 2305UL9-9 TaxID=3121638 RepID=UPI003527F267